MARNPIDFMGGKGADQNQQLADETVGSGKGHGGEGKKTEQAHIEGHDLAQAGVDRNQTAVGAFIDNAHAEEEAPGSDAVVDHLQDSPLEAVFIENKGPQGDKTHVGHTGIGDQTLHVGLTQGHIPAINDGNNGHNQESAARNKCWPPG